MGIGFNVDTFASLGVHGAMALIILAQVVLMIRVVDLIRKNVVPLASNHFKHVEDAFDKLSTQAELHELATRASIEATKTNTVALEAQGRLLRRMLDERDA